MGRRETSRGRRPSSQESQGRVLRPPQQREVSPQQSRPCLLLPFPLLGLLASLSHTFPRQWGHRWLGTGWRCPCSGRVDVCRERQPSHSARHRAEGAESVPWTSKFQTGGRPRLCPEPWPLGRESCQGYRMGFVARRKRSVSRESCGKVRPSAVLAASQYLPCSGKMATGPGHSLAGGCPPHSGFADFLPGEWGKGG